MDQKKLSLWLKAVVIGIALSGLVVYLIAVPSAGASLRASYPEFAYCYWPWLIFLWLTAVPLYMGLLSGYRIAGNIGRDRSFCVDNALLFARVARLAAVDTAFFFVGNVVYLFLGLSHPGILLMSLMVCFFGVAITVAAACLSHLVRKAADLQEQSDLTI